MICTYANNLLGRLVFDDTRADFSPTVGDNHILHMFKETVSRRYLLFWEENKMYTERGKQWRKVEKFTEEKIRRNYKKAAKRLWHIWHMRQMWCGHNNNKGWHMNTGVFVTNTRVRIAVHMWHGRSAFWRCYYVTLFWKCTLPAGHQIWYLLSANFDSEVKCGCKFRMNQHRRDTTLRWWANIKGRSFSRRLRYILVCWDYMSSSQTKKTIDTQRRWLVQDCNYS